LFRPGNYGIQRGESNWIFPSQYLGSLDNTFDTQLVNGSAKDSRQFLRLCTLNTTIEGIWSRLTCLIDIRVRSLAAISSSSGGPVPRATSQHGIYAYCHPLVLPHIYRVVSLPPCLRQTSPHDTADESSMEERGHRISTGSSCELPWRCLLAW
jgi:hypothetical protein